MNAAGMASMALRLITANGRAVTMLKSGTTEAVAGKPWRGVSNGYASTTAGTETAAVAVFTDYREAELEGDSIRRGDKRLLVAASGTDFTGYDGVRDGSDEWRIVSCTVTKPGDTAILYTFQVRQ